MDLFRSVGAVAGASGDGVVDWAAVSEAAKSATEPGSLDLSPADREGYAADVRDARDRIREVGGVEFDVPETIALQNRHHWIDANVDTFQRLIAPMAEEVGQPLLPGASRVINTGSMSFSLAFLARNVLGQYDPLLLAEADGGPDHELYFVHPNIERTAKELNVEFPRFRRWIAFHEVTHAAEFGAADWLPEYLESRMRNTITELSAGGLNREAFSELDAAMTAVEGYAELLMDRAFDEEYDDLRRKIDARRGGNGPVDRLVRRLLGLGLKRRQYERGAEFFNAVADTAGLETAAKVWDEPGNLPSDDELDDPSRWLARIE
ncbi:zinc-dependent metalloprotease [Halolamina litorea]|uniref:Zinc-dependent metalloprotease n=1 Tax=Halolamina litorea TaxID=1515593 RepID=A0ABD6BUK1_9EURY|nr:zinc-dependent metalloprotease [Halolamina litorea]